MKHLKIIAFSGFVATALTIQAMELEKKPQKVLFAPEQIKEAIIIERISQHDPMEKRLQRIKQAYEETGFARKYLLQIDLKLFVPGIYKEDFLYNLLYLAQEELTNAQVRRENLINIGKELKQKKTALLKKKQKENIEKLQTIQKEIDGILEKINAKQELIKKMATIVELLNEYLDEQEQKATTQPKIDKPESKIVRKKIKMEQD